MKPTDYAKDRFRGVTDQAHRIVFANSIDDKEVRMGLGGGIAGLGQGLEEMATGLRATYILLEQVNKKLDQLLTR
jgi:hypothetical protein